MNPENATAEKLLSYIVEHLTMRERNLFSQLGVFRDGFNKELVCELTNPDANDDPAVRESIQTDLEAFASLNFLTCDGEQGYYRMQPIIQDFAWRRLGHAPEIWYRLGKVFTTSTSWYNNLANSGADGYLLSALVFDEHKTTIRDILQYLVDHPSAERDHLLLDFHDLISLFGNVTFCAKN